MRLGASERQEKGKQSESRFYTNCACCEPNRGVQSGVLGYTIQVQTPLEKPF
jgi:hypothetical protein